jgi:hypothetical protein
MEASNLVFTDVSEELVTSMFRVNVTQETEVAASAEMLVTTYKTIRWHLPEDHNVNISYLQIGYVQTAYGILRKEGEAAGAGSDLVVGEKCLHCGQKI